MEFEARLFDSATKLMSTLMTDMRGKAVGERTGVRTGTRAERMGAGSFLMEDLDKGGLGGKCSKDVRALIQPLSKGYETVRRQDLRRFWSRVERHMPGVCPDVRFEDMRRRHICALGPHILGDTPWEKVEKRHFDSWEEFKGVVQEMYGLTDREMRRSFRALKKDVGESDEEFILRVEEARYEGRYKKQDCVDDFLPKTSRHFQDRILDICHSNAIQRRRDGEVAVEEVQWEDVVALARMREYAGQDFASVAAAPPTVAKPLDGARYRASAKSTGKRDGVFYGGNGGGAGENRGEDRGTGGGHSRRPRDDSRGDSSRRQGEGQRGGREGKLHCPLCDSMGRSEQAKTHDLAHCYANPKGAMFRPGVWKWRCREIAKAGGAIPAEMAWEEGQKRVE